MRFSACILLGLMATSMVSAQMAPAPKSGEPKLDYRQIMVITERQSEACEFLQQRTCKTSRSADKCVNYHRDHAAEYGANAIMLLMTNTATGAMSFLGKDTTMLANYYRCPVKGEDSEQSEPTSDQAPSASDDTR